MSFLGMKTVAHFDGRPLRIRKARARKRYLFKAGGLVTRIAKRSIKKVGQARKEPRKFTSRGRISAAWRKWKQEVDRRPSALPGRPPFTHSGSARDAIRFAVDLSAESVFAGPSATDVDDVMGIHEHGGVRFGRRYPARPTMRPAMDTAAPKLPTLWAQAFGSA